MPKTKDAFALRTVIDKAIFAKTKTMLEYDAYKARNFAKMLNIPLNYSIQNIFRNAIEMSQRMSMYIERVEKHIYRLERLLRKCGYDNVEKTLKIRNRQTDYLKMCTTLSDIEKFYNDLIPSIKSHYQQTFSTNFGKRLQTARKNADLNQIQVADELNISQNAYSQYERGLREPPLFLIYEFSQMFNVSIDWLFGKN